MFKVVEETIGNATGENVLSRSLKVTTIGCSLKSLSAYRKAELARVFPRAPFIFSFMCKPALAEIKIYPKI
jgi:hypothetical protein